MKAQHTDPSADTFEVLQHRTLALYGARASSRFVQLATPRMRAHVLEAGHGRPLVIVHGGDGEAVDWAPLIASLQDQFHVYAVDRPGFGLSDPFDYRTVPLREHAADFMGSLLDALDLRSAVVIGGSFGGFFAIAFALAHPERVDKLVLVGMPVGISRHTTWPLRVLCGVPGAARMLMRRAATLQGQRQQYRHEFHIDPDTIPELYFRMRVAGVQRPGAQKTFAQALRRLGGLHGMNPEIYLGEDLAKLDVPTLFIWGEKDDMAPIADAQGVSARMPDSEFVVLPQVGHFPFLENPVETGARIAQFVQRSRTSPGQA